MEPNFSFDNLLRIVKKRFWFFVIIGTIAAIAVYIFTLPAFMTPRYSSYAVVYPKNIFPYSEESETEQMLQLLEFSEIKDSVVTAFKLYDRWGLTPGEAEYNYWLNLLYEERVSISPTRFESIRIEAQDEDPEVALKMVQKIIDVYNLQAKRQEISTHAEYVDMKEKEIKYLNDYLDTLNFRMNEIRSQVGIAAFDGQIEQLTEGYMRMLERNEKGQNLKEVKQILSNVASSGGGLKTLEALATSIGEIYNETLDDLKQEYSYTNRNLTYCDVVVKPEKSDKKSWPVRWILFLAAVLSALLFTLVVFAFIDKY